MGSPSYTQDDVMSKTFGWEPEIGGDDEFEYDDFEYNHIRNNVECAIENGEWHTHKPVLEFSYNGQGFVIHSQDVDSGYMSNASKQDMINEIALILKGELNESSRLKHFIKMSAANNENLIEDYLDEAVDAASDVYGIFRYILDKHTNILMQGVSENKINLLDYSKLDDAVDAAFTDIKAAISEELIEKMAATCVNADIKDMEDKVLKIAKENDLKLLEGSGWVSGLVDYDFEADLT